MYIYIVSRWWRYFYVMHYMLRRTEKSTSHKQVAMEYKCSWTLVGSPQCYIRHGCNCLNMAYATANERPDDMSMHRSTCWQTVGSAASPERWRIFEKPSSPGVRQRLLSETDPTSRKADAVVSQVGNCRC